MESMATRLSRVAVLLALLALLAPLPAAAAEAKPPVVKVSSDGTVTVTIQGSLVPGLNAFPAPVPPQPATIEARINGTSVVPVIYENNTIYIATDKPGTVVITYLANVTSRDGFLETSINGNGTVELVVEPGVVLGSLPEKVVSVKQYRNGTLVILAAAPFTLRYTIVAAKPAPATTTQTATATPTPTQTATPSPTSTASPTQTATATPTATKPATTTPAATAPATTTKTPAATQTVTAPAPPPPPPPPKTQGASSPASPPSAATPSAGGGMGVAALAAAVAIVAAVVAAALLVLRRGRGGPASGTGNPGGSPPGGSGEAAVTAVPRGIDEVDERILRKLEEAGGVMYQSQLLRETGLPKTTLWRHVRKLEELGYIRVVREGRSNKLILLRTPWGSG